MAATGNLGVPHAKTLSSELSRGKFSVPTLPFCRLTCTSVTARQYTGIALPWRSRRTLVASHVEMLNNGSVNEPEEASEEESSHPPSQLIPNAHDVEFFVSELCDTTTIAEVELKLNGFRLHIRRDLDQNVQPPSSPPASANLDTRVEAPVENGSVMLTSLAIYKPGGSEAMLEENLLDSAADEGLVLIHSPKVGFFRRGRMRKKRLLPPPCKEGQTVKEGQVICYIEQLGGSHAVESNVAGEVVKFLLREGDPVGFGDAVVAVLPSFPGIKHLQ